MGTGDETNVSAYPRPSSGSPSFPDLEVEVLDYWDRDGTFRASIDRRDGAKEYVFYDGPPFANGLPHYGHLLTGYVKDIVPRYRTMRGFKVERRFGWDTHGLPAELEVQRQLGIRDKAQIEAMGIEAFNDACRASVMKYSDEWQAYVTRQARWVDFDNDYKTLDPTFMESVIWAFKQLWDKGLAYEGNRVLPYCWNDETPLSSHELRMDDDVYQNRQDPALTVGFRIADGELADAYLVVWTTTPWTLPSNQAVAVNPDVTYVHVQGSDGRRYVLAEPRLASYARELGEEPGVLGAYSGTQLLGTRYVPPFPYFMDSANAFRVLPGDFVTTEDGTGVVHMAPAYGEDDKATADLADIAAVTPVDARGRFDATVPDYAGQHVFEANPHIIRDLKNGTGPAAANAPVLLRHETYDHSYPHCWRCRNPLIYRAVSSWFIKVTEFRDRMVELNQQITWYPEHVKDGQFGKWLQGARDWSISRNRYWGSPIPVWKSDDPAYPRIDVYGSLDELERDFGVRPTNLHRPFIDELTRPNPDDPTGNSTMRRIEDVLDVWFDSGSMPFAQVHYPFENQKWFDGVTGDAGSEEAHFPGDFIVEYIGQTRGWFYTLHVLATALFDKPAFRTCVAHGIVLGNDGQKMSKSLRNYPDVSEVFDRDGSDAMRWFLMASPILRGGNLVVTEQGIRDGVRQVLLPFWNAYSFLALYAPQKGTWRTDSTNVLDRYVLAKLAALRDALTVRLDTCDVSGACEDLRQFTEALTNWYVRRSRSRFWDEDSDAIDTLHTVLEVVGRLAAPLLPLISEVVWRGVTGERSVHLTDWPEAGEIPADPALVTAMDQVREVCSTASSVRKAKKLRVRLPLLELTVAVEDPAALAPFSDLIADELNVKSVVLTDDIDAYGRFELAVNAKVAGPRLGKDVQAAIKAVKSGEGVVNHDGTLTAGPAVLQPGEYTSKLVAAEPEWTAALPDGAGLVVLDGTLTPELEAEGWAKDRIRELQDLRKSSGLDVSDRITVTMSVPAQRRDWADTHAGLIAGEVLATGFTFGDSADAVEIGDGVKVAIAKA